MEPTKDAGKRKHNNVQNPNDLSCLGEDAIGVDLHSTLFTPELNLVRKPNSFVGLKVRDRFRGKFIVPLAKLSLTLLPLSSQNLGATCYMNCLLQALFHSSAFRAGLYAFTPANKESESSVVYQLQLLFGYLELGVKAYYDPTPFTTEIGLAPQVQQDVQEFFKALSTYLEEQLSGSPNPKIQTLVQDLFSGQMAYVTQCKTCKTESKTRSAFYELDMHIDGVATIEKSIESYIRPEELSGNNQYHCGNCETKRDASRFIEITSKLPQILNFQLMRFVFDWETETKKKVKTAIEFPEFLDMNKFVRDPDGLLGEENSAGDGNGEEEADGKGSKRKKPAAKKPKSNPDLHYRLAYVLVHRGQSAYGGHYIAFVRDEETGAWWKFNDETAEPVTDLAKALASNVDLAPGVIKTSKKAASAEFEEFEDEESAQSTAKNAKKTPAKRAAAQDPAKAPSNERWKSSSAYMLGYARVGTTATKSVVPAEIATQVTQQNDSFQSVVDRQTALLKTIEQTIRERKIQRELLAKTGLCARPDNPTLRILPKKSIADNADDLESAQARVTSNLEDCHWISSDWYTKWLRGGDTSMDGDSKSTNDHSPSTATNPSPIPGLSSNDSAMDIDVLSTVNTEPKLENDVEIMQVDQPIPTLLSDDSVLIMTPQVPKKPTPKANFALLCEHGKMDPLKIYEAKRISPKAWKLLNSFIPFGPSLDKNSFCVECSLNIVRYGANKNEDEMNKSDILSAIKMPDNKNGKNSVEATYWISKDWLAIYSKKLSKNSELDPTINSTLQCPHGLLSPDSRVRRRIPATQWSALKASFPAALEFPSVLTTGPMPKPIAKETKAKPTAKATAKKAKAASATPISTASFFGKKIGSQGSSSSGKSSSTAIDLEDDLPPADESQDLTNMTPRTANKKEPEEDTADGATDEFAQSSTSRSVTSAMALMDGDDEIDSIPHLENKSTDKSRNKDSQISATSMDLTDGPDALSESNAPKGSSQHDPVELEGTESEDQLLSAVKEDENSTSELSDFSSLQQGRASVRLASVAASPPVRRPQPSPPPRKPKSTAAVSHAHLATNLHTEEEAEEMDVCAECLKDMHEDSEVRSSLAKRKTNERRKFATFLASIPSSIQSRLQYAYATKPSKPAEYFMVHLPWAIEWRKFLKESEIFDPPGKITNSRLLCEHNRLMFDPSVFFNDTEKNTSFAIATAETWEGLRKTYGADRSLSFFLNPDGSCDGYTCCFDCMEKHNLDREVQAAVFMSADLYLTVEDCRTNKRKRPAGGLSETSRSRGSKKNFISGVSYLDTVGMLKMKIFEKYDVPPAEFVLINNHGQNPLPIENKKGSDKPENSQAKENGEALSPIFLDDEDKTLEFYDVRSDRSITVRLVDPMDRDVYKASDERNAGFGATVLMGKRNNGNGAAVPDASSASGVYNDEKAADTSLYEETNGENGENGAQDGAKVSPPINAPHPKERSSSPQIAIFDPDMDESTRSLIEKLTQEDKDAEAAKSLSRTTNSPAPQKSVQTTAQTKSREASQGTKEEPVVVRDASSLNMGSWKCRCCGAENTCLLVTCEVCDSPTEAKTWTCDNCRIRIHSSIPQCMQCSMPRDKRSHIIGDDDYSDLENDETALQDDDDYEEEKPKKRTRKAKATPAARPKRNAIAVDDDDDEELNRSTTSSTREKRRALVPAERLKGAPASPKRSKQL